MKYAPYSHSKISKAHCPYAFKRRYIDRDKGRTTGNLRFGAAVHQIMADILNANVRQQPYDVIEVMKQNTWIDLVNRVDEIRDITNTFIDKFQVNLDNVVGVEEKVAIDINGKDADWDKAYLRGILDIVEIDGTHATITDHKTQYNILSDEDMAKNSQLTFYALLTKAFYPQVESFTVRIYFARYGFTKSADRTIEDIQRCWENLQVKVSAIESIDEWVPIPGPTCSICEHMHECPLAKYDPKGNEVSIVMNASEAVRQAKLLRVREEQVKRIKAALSRYSGIHGPIKASDEWEYGYIKRESVDWPIEQTCETFKNHDHSIEAHISFSKPSMRKLIARAKRLDPEFADELESICKHKSSTTFRGYKT